MEFQTIKTTTNNESTFKTKGKQGSVKENSFSNALEKVVLKDRVEAKKVDNTSNKATEVKTDDSETHVVKIDANNANVANLKSLEEISGLDPSLQNIMSMLQAFISGKIDLENLLNGVSKDIKGIIEQKTTVDLNGFSKDNKTDDIKQLSLELTEVLTNLKQNENISKDFPSIIMDELKSYIKDLESDVKNKTVNPQVAGTLEDKIKGEISNIVLRNLKENGVKVTDTADGIKVINVVNQAKETNNKGYIKEILKNENSVSSLNENINDSKITKLDSAEKNPLLSKNLISSEKNTIANEEKILKSIIAPDKELGDKDSSIAKATNFISQFESVGNEKITTEALVINKNSFSSDIVKSVKFMQTNNLKNLTVTIAPKELGEVIIKLTMYGGTMKASITATNKEAYNILNSNLTDITNKLNLLDAKIQDVTLNIYNGDTTFFKQGSKGENSKNQNSKRPSHVLEEVGEVSLTPDTNENDVNNVNILA